mgnify:CR=1 FL=1
MKLVHDSPLPLLPRAYPGVTARSRRPATPVAGMVLLVLLLGGCIGGGRSPEPDYYLLTAATGETASRYPHLALGVGPVRVSPFLDRTRIATHNGATIRMHDGHRWAEPLDEAVQRVLVQNLGLLTGADVRNFPWTRRTQPDLALRVDVLDLNATASGEAVLEVNWVLEDIPGDRLVHSGHDTFSRYTANAGADTEALVRAYSDLLGRLAIRIVEKLPPPPEASYSGH